jgi:hypothetical protein
MKLIVAELLKKFSFFLWNPGFSTMFARIRDWTVFRAWWVEVTTSNFISMRPILILSSEIFLYLQKASYRQVFWPEFSMNFLTLACAKHTSIWTISPSLLWWPWNSSFCGVLKHPVTCFLKNSNALFCILETRRGFNNSVVEKRKSMLWKIADDVFKFF